MNTTSNTRTVSGIIEYRGRTVAAHVPIPLLTLDAMSYAIARVEALRVEALDPEYTSAERRTIVARANFLDQWIDSGCVATVPFNVDFNLSCRGVSVPVVVMNANLDEYLDALLSASSVVPLQSLNEPAFAIRNNDSESELWLTDARTLRNARLNPGPDVRVIEATVGDLKAIIATHQMPSMFLTSALVA